MGKLELTEGNAYFALNPASGSDVGIIISVLGAFKRNRKLLI